MDKLYDCDKNHTLGKGSYGKVFKGSKKSDRDCEVAIKRIENDDFFSVSAARELRILKGLKHENVVSLFDDFRDVHYFWIVMEYCDGGNLEVFLKKQNPGLGIKLYIMHDCSKAVNYMHSQSPQIIHRDLKLQNILLKAERGRYMAKVCDFGLSRAFVPTEDQSMHTECGTLFYRAPELMEKKADGKYHYHAEVDIFSLGLVFQVILQYNGDTKYLEPTIVGCSSKMIVATMMLSSRDEDQAQPQLFAIDDNEDQVIQAAKSLVVDMTKIEPKDRIAIKDVLEIIESIQISKCEACPVLKKQVQSLEKDNSSLSEINQILSDEVTCLQRQIEDMKSQHEQYTTALEHEVQDLTLTNKWQVQCLEGEKSSLLETNQILTDQITCHQKKIEDIKLEHQQSTTKLESDVQDPVLKNERQVHTLNAKTEEIHTLKITKFNLESEEQSFKESIARKEKETIDMKEQQEADLMRLTSQIRHLDKELSDQRHTNQRICFENKRLTKITTLQGNQLNKLQKDSAACTTMPFEDEPDPGEITLNFPKSSTANQLGSPSPVVVALCLGTSKTCCGLAFSFNPADIKILNISGGGTYGVPTSILTDENDRFIAYGYEAEEKYSEDPGNCCLYKNFTDKRNISIQSAVKATNSKTMPVVDIFSMALEHLMKTVMVPKIQTNASSVINPDIIQWVVTVPAFMGHQAQVVIKQAIFKAGYMDPENVPNVLVQHERDSLWTCYEASNHKKVTDQVLLIHMQDDSTVVTTHSSSCRESCVVYTTEEWSETIVKDILLIPVKNILLGHCSEEFESQYNVNWNEVIPRIPNITEYLANFERSFYVDISFSLGSKLRDFWGQDVSSIIRSNAKDKTRFSSGQIIFGEKTTNEAYGSAISQAQKCARRILHISKLLNIKHAIIVGSPNMREMLDDALTKMLPVQMDVTSLKTDQPIVKGAVKWGLQKNENFLSL